MRFRPGILDPFGPFLGPAGILPGAERTSMAGDVTCPMSARLGCGPEDGGIAAAASVHVSHAPERVDAVAQKAVKPAA
jgi:hypothetical protein